MARKLRLEYPGAGDQMMNRGMVADGKNKSIWQYQEPTRFRITEAWLLSRHWAGEGIAKTL